MPLFETVMLVLDAITTVTQVLAELWKGPLGDLIRHLLERRQKLSNI